LRESRRREYCFRSLRPSGPEPARAARGGARFVDGVRRLVCVWPDWLDWLLDGKKAFVSAILNGITLAGLYFLVASGFTLVFGLMRNVNLAHESLYLLGAYVGYDIAQMERELVPRRSRGRRRHRRRRRAFADFRLPEADWRRVAADAGHDRHLHRRRRPHARHLGRQDLPVLHPLGARRRRRDADHHRDQVERTDRDVALPALSARRARHLHRHRRRPVARAQPHDVRPNDSRWRRRPRHATCGFCSLASSPSAGRLPASPGSSAARRVPSRLARTCATSWRRSSSSSSEAWAPSSAQRLARSSSDSPSSLGSSISRPTVSC